jgi:hypothetical protein
MNEIMLSFQVRNQQEERKMAADNQEGLEEVLEDRLTTLLVSRTILLGMVEMMELEYHSYNDQA